MGFIIFIIIIVVIIVAIIIQANTELNEREKARKSYLASLEKLKNNPTNPNIKQQTLQLGREYSHLTRNKKGVAIFDEIALMNDINAACAAATISEFSSNSMLERHNNTSSTIQEKINTLTSLYEQGVIDEKEFQQRKKQILDNI
ncbi:SHOCT domain-containing protein [Neisseria shayeganii]|uniref:Putative integron gene cassette protein n=1 Tax=Neisseria shayeganii 871 TaxID=1032488 RepID=G4CH40_9NEIS|nr:SHOCT domain-containing protein [Neisseria shayeganii]EGY52841.1 putative integron gene cassette protein [Neisseria shayeganii 871]